jgi:hypothetical protein
MSPDQQTTQASYRLIVTRRNRSEILLSSRGRAWSLPSVEIAHGLRIAEQLCATLYAQSGFRAYCLLVPALVFATQHCAVMEAADPGESASAGTCWKPLDAATCAAMESLEDRTVTQKSIAALDLYRRRPLHAPFARPGWLSELLAWAREQLGPPGLTGAFTQLNASPAFSLMRLETNDSAVWFKATGEPNRHELPITACVARLFPGYVPELLAVHSGWNGWLTREAPGRKLALATGLPLWLKAAHDLARLQISSIGKQAELLAGSCRDLRVRTLSAEIDPFIDHLRGLMAAQDKQRPAPLTDSELTLLRDSLEQACSRLCEMDLPDTLGHLDLNPGNIVVSPERSRFLDWAEGCVTNPLITFAYLSEHFRRSGFASAQTTEALAAAYLDPWLSLVSASELARAMELTPLLAVFAYAVTAHSLRSFEGVPDPALAGYLRSLARRMWRETTEQSARSESCPA